MTIGAMFVWVSSRIWEGRLHAGGLRRVIIIHQREPLTGGMEVGYGIDGSHAAMVAPMQAHGESRWDLLVVRSAYASAAFVASLFVASLWVSEWGTSWDLGTTGSGARIARTRGGTRRSSLGQSTRCCTAAPSPRGGDERICVRVSVIISYP